MSYYAFLKNLNNSKNSHFMTKYKNFKGLLVQ